MGGPRRLSLTSKGWLALALAGSFVAACSGKENDGDGDDGGSGAAPSGGAAAGGETSGGDGGMGPGSGGMESNSGGMGGMGCESDLPIVTQAPALLSDTGMYEDIADKVVAPYLMEFAPKFVLWSDGAEKTRWLYLPSCDGTIDTSNMDSWVFPVGTYAFKQFVVDEVLVETRLIHRYGPGPQDWLYATYVWNDEKSDAALDLDGHTFDRQEDPDYVVPSVNAGDCARCHGPNSPGGPEFGTGLPSRLLGVNAIDLSHEGPGVTIEELSEGGHLSVPAPEGFTPPGNATEVAAIGYLHANCGYCHNDTPLRQKLVTDYELRLKTEHTTLEQTGAYRTAVNQLVTNFVSQDPDGEKCTHRIYGGDADLSCVHERMDARGTSVQMPPLDSMRPHTEGLQTIENWIVTLDPPALGGSGGGN